MERFCSATNFLCYQNLVFTHALCTLASKLSVVLSSESVLYDVFYEFDFLSCPWSWLITITRVVLHVYSQTPLICW